MFDWKQLKTPTLRSFRLAWFSSCPWKRGQIISKRNRDGNGEKLHLIFVLWIVRARARGLSSEGLIWAECEMEMSQGFKAGRSLLRITGPRLWKWNGLWVELSTLAIGDGAVVLFAFCLIAEFTGRNLLPVSGQLLLCRCEKQVSQLMGVVAVIIFEQLVPINSIFQLRDTCRQCLLVILEYRTQCSDFTLSLCVN